MLYYSYRALPGSLSLGLLLTLPCIACAEVSDKVPSSLDIWLIGLGAASICALAGHLRRWLVLVVCVAPALWFIALLLEIHSPDAGPALYAEQGRMYYLNVYLALAAVAVGAAWGWGKGRR